LNPTLGVVIPAYNSEAVIADAIRSAFGSGADRVVVVDDGSSDRTGEVASALGAEVYAQKNAGASRARQTGGRLIDTDYVIFLDADDELVPSGVARSIETLESDPSLSVSAGVLIGFSRSSGQEERFPIRYSPVTTESLLTRGHGPWPPCNAVVRTSALRATESMSPSALHPRFADDYELLIRLSRTGGIAVRDDPTCRYSMDGGKSVTSAAKAIATKEDVRRYYSQAFGIEIEAMSPREVRRSAQARIARANMAARNWPAGAAALVRWFFMDPADSARRAISRVRKKLDRNDDK
jgi:glycosyltransferase involved in cell wall biosynthesis